MAKYTELLKQLFQGSSYRSPDVLTDKTKLLARRANVGAIDAPRLQQNIQNLSPDQRDATLYNAPRNEAVNTFRNYLTQAARPIASAQNFIENDDLRLEPATLRKFVPKVIPDFVVGAGTSYINAIPGQILRTAVDTGVDVGRTIRGDDLQEFNKLRSPATKIGRTIAGKGDVRESIKSAAEIADSLIKSYGLSGPDALKLATRSSLFSGAVSSGIPLVQSAGDVLKGKEARYTLPEIAKEGGKGLQRGLEDFGAYKFAGALASNLAKVPGLSGVGKLNDFKQVGGGLTTNESARNLVGNAVKRAIRATFIETPFEAPFYGARDVQDGERLEDSIYEELLVNGVMNNFFAQIDSGIELGKAGKELSDAIKNTNVYKSTLGSQEGLIRIDPRGNKYVDVQKDQGIFKGKSPVQATKIAKDYLNNNLRGKTVKIDDNGEITFSSRGNTKYTNPQQKLTDELLRVKMRLVPEVDNALSTSKLVGSSPDIGGKHGKYASDGFDYRRFEFDIDGQRFEGTANIAKGGVLQNFYDVHPIKKSPAKGIVDEKSSTPFYSGDFSEKSIPQNTDPIKNLDDIVAFRSETGGVPKVAQGAYGPGEYLSLSKGILEQEGYKDITERHVGFKNPLIIKDEGDLTRFTMKADEELKSLTEWAAGKGYDGVLDVPGDTAIDIRGLGAKIGGGDAGSLRGVEGRLKNQYPQGDIRGAKKSFITTDGKIILLKGEDAHDNVFKKDSRLFNNYLSEGGIRTIYSSLNGKHPYLNIEVSKAPTADQIKTIKSLPDDMAFVYDIRGNGKTVSSDVLTETKADFLKALNDYYPSVKIGGPDPLEALKAEAKKYKSADEFDAALYRAGRDISGELKAIYPDKDYFNALDSLVKGRVEKPAINYSNGIKVFHGSDNKFTKIDPTKSNLSSKTGVGKGHIFYSTDREIAGSYGKNVLEETIKPQNPLVVNADGLPWNDIKFEGKSLNINELAKLAEERGYGSLVVERVRDTGGKQVKGVPGGFKESTTIALFNNGNQAQATKGVEGGYDDLLNKKIRIQQKLKNTPDTYDNTNKLMRLKSDLTEVETGMANIRDGATGGDLNIPAKALPLVEEMRKFTNWGDFKAEADKSEHTPEMEFGSTMVNGTEIPYGAQRALSKWANSMGFRDNEEAFGAIKSVYPKELKKIQTESSGGRGVPPSGANRLNPAVPIPDIRDSRSIIPQNSATGTTPTIYKGLVPETLNAQKTSLPSTSGDSTENRLTRAQSAPQRISQTQDRQGFELDQSVTKSQRVGQSSKESISPISVNKETGRVENRYVTDARARIEEIDAQIANTRAELNAKKEVVATTRGMFSDETVRLINKIKGIAGRGRYAAGDVETLRNSKHARGVNDAVERVREAMGIQGDDEAFEFIKNFPTKRTASDGKITSLLEEKRALQEFISDANKQSGTFVQVRSKTNRAAERAINDFREWETQVFKQEGAITRKRLDKQLAGEIASMVRQNTKPAYLKNVEQLKDISNVGKGMTDVYRNVEHVFGKDSQVKREMLDPLDISRATLVDDLDLWGNKLQAEIVDSLGIKPNTKESAAVQQYGEKLRDYDSLVKEFGEKKAQNIKDADRWFRKQYDTLLSEVNTVRSKIYPNNPDKLIPRRNDYYRHFRDLSDTFAGLKNLFESSAGIDPSLSGVSEYVKPKSKWLSFAQQRLGMKTKYDAVGGFVDYVNAQSYAKHIDPHINKFRMLREELVSATSDKTKPGYGKLNNFIEFLDDYANDLAGKTNPADRALQKYIGRNPYRVLNWVNSRTKLNVILGNLSSAVAQFFNIPQGLAEAGPVNSARGGIRTLSSILSDDKAMAKSLFLKARYADDLATRFDTSIIGDAKRAAAWITSIGDEVGTKFIWNSLYEKGLKEGVDNPVKYADDLTRKMVAGRGIGEVPLLQKSKTFQLIAPFQLEVGNVWHVMREWAGEKAANKFVTFFVASYVMNRMAKNLRGSDVSFDPINAMIEAANTLEEEENTGRGAFMAAGRLLGEILSNAPLGQSIASVYPEYGAQIGDTKLPTREDFFGEGDPTRFGSGLLFVRGVTDPLAVVPPFGGQQLKRTYQGIQSWARGYDESASGKIRMPIEQSPINLIKSATFGKYSTKDARDYFNNDRSVLGEKQSETYKRIYKTQGPEAAKRYYDSIISKREGGGASGAFEGASGNAFSGGVIATGLQGTPKTKKGRAGRRPSLKSTPRLVITRPKAAPKFRVTRKPVSKVSGVSTKGLPKFRIVRA